MRPFRLAPVSMMIIAMFAAPPASAAFFVANTDDWYERMAIPGVTVIEASPSVAAATPDSIPVAPAPVPAPGSPTAAPAAATEPVAPADAAEEHVGGLMSPADKAPPNKSDTSPSVAIQPTAEQEKARPTEIKEPATTKTNARVAPETVRTTDPASKPTLLVDTPAHAAPSPAPAGSINASILPDEVTDSIGVRRLEAKPVYTQCGTGSRIHFPSVNSRILTPKMQMAIDTFAKQAIANGSKVVLRSRLGLVKTTPSASRLAMLRGLAVREALIKAGVPANNIRLFYSGTGKRYSTIPACNQRVDVEVGNV